MKGKKCVGMGGCGSTVVLALTADRVAALDTLDTLQKNFDSLLAKRKLFLPLSTRTIVNTTFHIYCILEMARCVAVISGDGISGNLMFYQVKSACHCVIGGYSVNLILC